MISPRQLIKATGPKLVPFFLSSALYFVMSAYDHRGEIWSTVLKCAPIYSLILFVMLYGIQNTHVPYSSKILGGLFFSSMGDLFLNINLFEIGVMAFAIAQIFFIIAFGLKPRKWAIGIALYMTVVVTFTILVNYIDGVVLKVGLPIYSILLITMAWRAVARVENFTDCSDLPKIVGAVGGVLFVISDSFLAFNMFYTSIPYSMIFTMVPYYLAELGIAFSIVEYNKPPFTKSKLADKNHFEISNNNSPTNSISVNGEMRQRRI